MIKSVNLSNYSISPAKTQNHQKKQVPSANQASNKQNISFGLWGFKQNLAQQSPVSAKYSAWQNSLNTSAAHLPTLLPNFTKSSGKNGVSVYLMNTGATMPALISKYAPAAKIVVEDLKSRAGQKGQYLNWVGVLPNEQLKNIDKIYDMADKARKNGPFKNLAVIGIGGSRHTNEAMAKLLNMDKNVHFYSGIDNISFNRFINKVNPKDTMFLVVSKSGKTLETLTGYQKSREAVEKVVGKEEAKKHFVTMTDKDPNKSKLRQAVNKGDIPIAGLVHDDVGGRFSILDDATIFTLAYQGLPKEATKALLNGSINAQKEYMNPDIEKNKALQQAIFNVEAKNNGKTKHFVQYFGDYFAGAQFWEKQQKNESIKDKFYTDSNVGPAYLHYNAESDLSPGNKDSAYTIVNIKPNGDKTLDADITGVLKAYSKQHPVSHIQLDNLKPETIGKFIELKHFETMYTGMLMRDRNAPRPDVLPEVLQPNVQKYKAEVIKELAKK